MHRVAIGAVVLSACSAVVTAQVSPSPVPPRNSVAIQAHIAPSVMAADELHAVIEVHTSRKEVHLNWWWGEVNNSSAQVKALEFWPTAATLIDPGGDTFYVAGKDSITGRMVVEKWVLTSFSPVPTDATIGHKYSAKIVRQPVYQGSVATVNGARFLYPAWGAPTPSLFVHMADTGDLKRLDLATGVLSAGVSAAAAPSLQNGAWSTVYSGEHPDQGVVYVYNSSPAYGLSCFVLLDQDKDGMPDSWHDLADRAAWEALNLGDPTQDWVQTFP